MEKEMMRRGQWDWRDIVSTAMELSSQNAGGQAKLFIGPARFCRLDVSDQIHPPLSRYVRGRVLSHGHLDPGMQVVTKPFDMTILASRITSMVSGT